MENSAVLLFLVPVEGYRYENITDVELKVSAATFEEALSQGILQGLSFHSVIADDPSENTAQGVTGQMETGYFVLYHLGANCCPAGDELGVIQTALAPPPKIDQLDIADVPVFVFEQPDSIDSRFTYLWIDQGTIAYFDGADRAPMERWLNRYLPIPKLAEHETPELSALLTVVPGFGYANVEPLSDLIALGQSPYSTHSLVDSDGVVGGLILAQTDDPTSLVQVLEGLEPEVTIETTEMELAGFPIQRLPASDGGNTLLWTHDGITGAIVVSEPGRLGKAEMFLEQFLAP